MAVARSRTAADIRRELEATEQRLDALIARWRETATTHQLTSDRPDRELLDRVEELLRHQRGTLERLHQLWIEYAQLSGEHAPQ
jgi:hypothetical protein